MVRIDEPSELIRKPLADLFSVVAFAVLLEDGILLFTELDIFPYGVIVALLRSCERRSRCFNYLNADSSGFYFFDLVLMLDVIAKNNGSRLQCPVLERFYNFAFDVFVAHCGCIKNV